MSDGTAELIERLRRMDIRVALEDGRLGVDAPKGALTPAVREELGRRKEEVLAWLRENAGGAGQAAASRRTDLAIERVPRGGPLAASFTQERLWFFDRLEPGNAAYNMHFGWCLTGPLDVPALEGALADIVARHEMLRTTFREVDGRVFQEIQAALPCALTLGELAPGEGEEQVLQRLEREALRPFDLERGPMVRALLLRQAADRHWLLIAYHHISGDGWSSEIFARELAALYSARVAGRPAVLAPLAVQYADFAHWQRSRFAQARLPGMLAWWKLQLEGAPAVLDLPLDHPRPAVQTFEGAACVRQVEPALRDRLLALSRAERTTLFVTLLAAFDVVLARWSGQDDLCVGVPVAGRDRSELEPLIGVFINTVVARARIGEATTFRELVGALRDTVVGAMAHRDAPFEAVAKALARGRDMSRTPLFQVLVNMLNFPTGGSGGFSGLAMEPVPVLAFGQAQSKFDLTLYLREEPAGITLAAVYNTSLFEPVRIDAMLEQYVGVLQAAVDAPDTPVMRVPLVTPSARPLLPDPSAALPAAWTEAVPARFRRHASSTPERVAAADVQGSITYGELEAASNRLANHLLAHGVGREDVVAIHAARNVALPWAMLGVLKAGAAFMLVDPAHPPARAAQGIRLARPKAWVRIDGTTPLPEPIEAALRDMDPVVAVSWPQGDWRTASAQAPANEPGPEDLAYVAFTSGSTGEPKGIAGTHRPLAHFFDWHERTSALGPQDRFSVLSGLAHDPLLRDVLGALWVGATICLPESARIVEPGYLGDWLAANRISVCHLTPAMAELLAIRSHGAPPELPAMRRVYFGGEQLRADTIESMRRVAPGASYANFYGATETPQAMGWYAVPGGAASVPARVPLGRGIEGVQLLVLNASGALAGIGELGEIHVRTPYLARGYLGDTALTAERFVPAPGAKDHGDRMYRTGDLGRYRPDGSVEFAGRRDGQVKLRGFRVELGEVEAALREHAAAGEAAVDLRAQPAREGQLVAYIVPRAGATLPGADALRDFLRARLPEYMVPAHFVAIERMPLTPNGKLDRSRLPAPSASAARIRVPLQGATQGAIAAIWRDVLGVAEIGAADDFFELGGHSLLATRVLARLRANLGVELPLRALFQAPTVAGLARLADEKRGAGASSETHEEIAI